MSEPGPLYDASLEEALLGAAIYGPAALDTLVDQLEPSDFGRHHHRVIFTAMVRLYRRQEPVDPLAVFRELEAMAAPPDIAPMVATLPLWASRTDQALIQAHCARLRGWSVRRRLRVFAEELLRRVGDVTVDSPALLEAAEAELYALRQDRQAEDWVNAEAWAGELMPVLEQLLERREPLMGVPTGWRELDDVTLGLKPGELWVGGARPAMGKTSWAIQIAMRAARAQQVVAFVSLEMSRREIGLRDVASKAQVSTFRLLRGYHVSDVETQRLGSALSELASSGAHILDVPILSPVQLRSKLRRLRGMTGKPIGLVVIDYLQLMAHLPEHQRESRHNQVAGVSRALKVLAREFECPILALCQLNRLAEGRKDHKPALADLRESGAIEQDADVVILLHRPHYYEADAPADQALAIVAKQRNGKTGDVELHWDASLMRFSDRRSDS